MSYFHKFKPKVLTFFPVLLIAALVSACGGGSPQAATDANLIPDIGAGKPSVDGELETQNKAPDIVSISLGCDLYMESIAVKLGDTTSFSLVVNDESPSTLTYSVSADDPLIVESSIGSDGVINLIARSVGETTAPVLVTDDKGNVGEILVSVIVET